MKRVLLLGALLALGACGDRSTLPVATSLSPMGADDTGAGYSPDGSRIYWWSRAGDMLQLWVSPADMSAPKKVPITSRSTGSLVWSPDGSRFAVGASMTSVFPRVWLVDTAAGEPRQLNTADALEQPLGWHPDGKRLAYVTVVGSSVFAMAIDVDSGPPTRMVPGEAQNHVAWWSPDGSKIALQVFAGGRNTIALADSLGGNLGQLTTEGFENLGGATTPWSPDGTTLLYTSTRTGAGDIWALPVDGDSARQLTKDVRDDNAPIWSLDGKWIAFSSNRGLQTDLWVMPAAGGPARRVTDDVAREQLIDFRPGTMELAYTTGRDSRTVWAHQLADGAERQLTPDSLEVAWFNVSSQGEIEVSINRGGGVFDLTVFPLAGGERRSLLQNAGTVDQAYWSPDGSMLAFLSDRGGSQDVWVVNAAGDGLRQLTTWPGQEANPVWSADSRDIYFHSDHDAKYGNVWRVPAAGGAPVQITSAGQILGLCTQTRPSLPLIVGVLSDGANTIEMARIEPDGSPRVIWNKSTAGCGDVSPTADTIAANVGGEGGTSVAMLISLDGSGGRQLLPPGELEVEWSPDGTQLVYTFTDGNAGDYGILTVADGTTRRITTTPADENGAEFSPDGSTLIFRRSVPIDRITTADLTKLLAAPQQ